jgi:hypothetical protein
VISLVENGEITRNLDRATLRRRLTGGLAVPKATNGRPLLGFRFK